MRIAVHQTHYLPWLRYFDKIAKCDVFVLLDDAQFNRNGYQNRNRIKSASGPVMLTVPVLQQYQQSLQNVRINATVGWPRKHWLTIEQNYRKAPYFERYAPELRRFYAQSYDRLVDLNRDMLIWFLEQLGIKTRVVHSHELAVEKSSTARLIRICQMLDATEYVSGAHAVGAYLDREAFVEAGIGLVCQQWSSPKYEQMYPAVGYVGDLSILDLLFVQGPNALAVLSSGGQIVQESAIQVHG